MGDVNQPLLIETHPVGITPAKMLGQPAPVVNHLVGMGTAADYRQTASRVGFGPQNSWAYRGGGNGGGRFDEGPPGGVGERRVGLGLRHGGAPAS